MNTNDNQISELLDELLNFKMEEVPESTRFWMIRTKGGYFYNEFITHNYVALAWNIITRETNFEQTDLLNSLILQHYDKIKRPAVVANKCRCFINDINVGDILVIPSEGSRYVTFAYAGEYYEEETKTYEIETNTIGRIEDREVQIEEVLCPYRKRRHIIPIRTVKSNVLNFHLYKAISSYHGISNLDSYGTIILDHIYNCYTYKNNARIVYHVGKQEQITSKEFSGFLYSVNSVLSSTGFDEHSISTQASVHSEGDIVFMIKETMNWLSTNYLWFVALAVAFGGGKFLTIEVPGFINIIKDIIAFKDDRELKKQEYIGKKLDNLDKIFELAEKIEQAGINVSELEKIEDPLALLSKCSNSMQITPLSSTTEEVPAISSETSETDNEEESA